MNRIPGLGLRLRPSDEAMGTDKAQMGEHAYAHLALHDLSSPPNSTMAVKQAGPAMLQSTREEPMPDSEVYTA